MGPPQTPYGGLQNCLKSSGSKEVNMLYMDKGESPAVYYISNRATLILDANYQKN